MRIVPQLVDVSHTYLPGVPLLAAPQIAGLLPARTSLKVEIVQHQAYQQEIPTSIGTTSPRVYHSFAEWRAADEELRQHFERCHPSLRNLYQRIYGEAANG